MTEAHTATDEARLSEAIATKQAHVAVVGLGFAGLPQAVAIAQAGFAVTGIDTDAARVARLRAGESYIGDVSAALLQALIGSGRLAPTESHDALAAADCIVICVPTSITADQHSNLDALQRAVESVISRIRPPVLLIVESSLPPGATRRLVLPPLAARSLVVGKQVFVAHAPERIDPGNATYGLRETPRVVGGVTSACRDLAVQLYKQAGIAAVPVSSVEVAETAKVFENTFRFVNISLANELARICQRLGVSVWEVLAAAGTKPYGFMPHSPGPGVGGSCIPVIPFFLAEVAAQVGVPSALIEAAGQINAEMPRYVADRAAALVGRPSDDLSGCRFLVLGVTYKPDQPDCRFSPAFPLISQLAAAGATVLAHDPVVPLEPDGPAVPDASVTTTLNADVVRSVDLVIVVTAHRAIDYDLVVEHARQVLDTRNALADLQAANVVPL